MIIDHNAFNILDLRFLNLLRGEIKVETNRGRRPVPENDLETLINVFLRGPILFREWSQIDIFKRRFRLGIFTYQEMRFLTDSTFP